MEEDAPPTMSLLDEDAGFASSTAALGPPRKVCSFIARVRRLLTI